MIQQQIKEQLKESMKARDGVRTLVLKGLLSAFTNELVAQRKKPSEELGDEDALNVIKRAVKQRKDSIEQFKKGGREDLASSEQAELEILNAYLPVTMSKEEITKIAQAKKEELGIEDKAKIGILIGALMKDLKDKADGGDVKEVVEKLF
ncbi:GatB/YqeY domain-containing protein [Candidatus Parcubacteria bacterium]|nr:GatB/YqeY domain-containing protein [Candidatus Parcubacteria bacterium]